MLHDLRDIISRFQILGKLVSIQPLKMGHINDTYISTWDSGTYVHQLINNYVFSNIPELMQNVSRITQHVAKKLSGQPVNYERALKLIPLHSGELFYKSTQGEYWRTYECVPNARSYYVCDNEQLAYEAGATCGRFQNYICDLDPSDFFTVIRDFHNTSFRYQQLKIAIENDPLKRVRQLQSELDFLIQRENECGSVMLALNSGELKWRVTHNDLKYNNVLFDLDSHKGVAVVDLDTCMPGTLMFDFGDLVRNASVKANEDETDLTKVFMRISFFEALTKGYLGQLKHIIEPIEWDLLTLAPKLITTTLAIRFLTDYINGDKYFKVNHATQNLDRARSQLKIVSSMEAQQAAMEKVVAAVRRG